jgi:hypothetical protein
VFPVRWFVALFFADPEVVVSVTTAEKITVLQV